LQDLRTRRRLRTVVVPVDEDEHEFKQVDLKKLKRHEREAVLEKAMQSKDQQNELLLKKMGERLRR
jgi:hypothetical protein